MDRPRCILTVDLEEWSDARLASIPQERRELLPPSLPGPVSRLLDLLEAHGARATFFVLGRVARRHPRLIREIAARHEIGSHGDSHEDLRRLSPPSLAREVRESKKRLEDLTGREVSAFRAPNWSLGGCLDWAAPVLEQEGIRYDSSVMPGRGLLFLPGREGTPPRPHRLRGTRGLWEFPPTVLAGPGFSFPAAGGAFLRLLPAALVIRVLEAADARREFPHVHLHPAELAPPADAGTGLVRRAVLFGGAASVPAKIERILERFRAVTIGTVAGELTRAEAA